MRVRISRVKVMTMPPAMVSIPLARWEGSWLLRVWDFWKISIGFNLLFFIRYVQHSADCKATIAERH